MHIAVFGCHCCWSNTRRDRVWLHACIKVLSGWHTSPCTMRVWSHPGSRGKVKLRRRRRAGWRGADEWNEAGKSTRRVTKHGHSAPLGAEWGFRRHEQGNQSPPICSGSESCVRRRGKSKCTTLSTQTQETSGKQNAHGLHKWQARRVTFFTGCVLNLGCESHMHHKVIYHEFILWILVESIEIFMHILIISWWEMRWW
jgi:hypothetical protein